MYQGMLRDLTEKAFDWTEKAQGSDREGPTNRWTEKAERKMGVRARCQGKM